MSTWFSLDLGRGHVLDLRAVVVAGHLHLVHEVVVALLEASVSRRHLVEAILQGGVHLVKKVHLARILTVQWLRTVTGPGHQVKAPINMLLG